ncbi:MAG: hypothetical protein JWM37_618 [Candidatus Saccharibacteria bacterium]|nr:hypothetical protein [Candidatus Saccharibacteria bacterium]
MKIFLATSAAITQDYRAFVEQVLAVLRDNDNEVYCELEQTGWQPIDEPLEVGLRRNLDGLNAADMIIALVAGLPSAEVEFMIGYAVARDKRIVLAKHIDDEIVPINKAVIANGQMTLVQFDTMEALAAQLTITVNAPAD